MENVESNWPEEGIRTNVEDAQENREIRWTMRATVERIMYLPDNRYLQLVAVKWKNLPSNRPVNPPTIFGREAIHANFLPQLERSQASECIVVIDFFTDAEGNNAEIVGISVLRSMKSE